MSTPVITPLQALFLGIVEGISEYLPISSTGHLVLTSHLLGLRDLSALSTEQIQAVQAFEIVIQGGAILAVLVLYWRYILDIVLGLVGKSKSGLKLAVNIACGTLPILIMGYLLKGVIGTYLQFTGPVLFSLAAGGIVMILFERRRTQVDPGTIAEVSIGDLTWQQAVKIGLLQCLALWPGTSRSMVTIIGGMLFGLKRPAAAEFSFLLGLPALLAATIYKAIKDGPVLLEHIGFSALFVGFATATIFAALAVRWLVSFLNRNGLTYFGWYRLLLAAALLIVTSL